MSHIPPLGQPLRLKWFVGLNYEAPQFYLYADMVRVAVLTATAYTSLAPHVLFDGPPCDFTEWLQRNGATVIHCRSSFHEEFLRLAEKTGNPRFRDTCPGIYLRAEIPALCEKLGWSDDYVLYTDTDVFFQPAFSVDHFPRDFSEPIAVAPESAQDDYVGFNTGVMLMNLPALRAEDEGLKAQLKADIEEASTISWDQLSYQRHFKGRIHRLSPLANWKPYWGDNPEAQVVHFHGPKPFTRPFLEDGSAFEIQRQLATPAFWSYCRFWDGWLERVRKST